LKQILGGGVKLIISRLDYIDIREIWQHEAADFTTWLAANIDYLNDKLGFAINVLETEKQIGSFNVDIYCEDEQLVLNWLLIRIEPGN
jgi:RecB family endonuclease NucS